MYTFQLLGWQSHQGTIAFLACPQGTAIGVLCETSLWALHKDAHTGGGEGLGQNRGPLLSESSHAARGPRVLVQGGTLPSQALPERVPAATHLSRGVPFLNLGKGSFWSQAGSAGRSERRTQAQGS